MNLYRNREDGEYSPTGSSKNYRSFLPEVYAGFPNRLDRFRQYDMMENDPEVNAALDILTDFCTQNNDDNDGNPFNIEFGSDTPDTIIESIQSALENWVKINRLDRRIFDIVRSALKYGDYFFVRDPETFELYPANPYKIEKVIVDESKGKEIEQYFIRDLELNLQAQVATAAVETTNNYSIPGTAAVTNITGHQGTPGVQTSSQMGGSQASRFINSTQSFAVNAEHVVHLSMNSGDDPNWPFGTSVLEPIYKTFKQKELLEDSIIIYRIQRAPERRVFKIDVGNLPHQKAMAFVERMKNEMHQRRIPTRDGSGSNNFTLMDTAYNPMCLDMNTKIPLLDGRTLTISELEKEHKEGKQNWAYSCDHITGKIVPGKITWAGKTRIDAKVLELTLDNGKTVICTPDHKLVSRENGFVEAQDVKVNDSMMPFYTREKSIGNEKVKYQQIYDNADKKWNFTHRVVGEYLRNTVVKESVFDSRFANYKKNIVHHCDFNSLNNDPSNLQYMSQSDHVLLHTEIAKTHGFGNNPEAIQKGTDAAKAKLEWLKENDQNSYQEFVNKRANSQKKWRESLTDEEWGIIVQKRNESIQKYRDNHPEYIDQILQAGRKGNLAMQERMKNSKLEKERRAKISKAITENWKKRKEEKELYNHKVVKIRELPSRDVGTITIDGREEFHAFHTFAIDAGIFIKNSILEDFYLPVTADGRGSDITTLPGGESLGQIDDLRNWNNKLIRGLKIPSSYLPFGPDDGTQTFNDGRTGQVLVQEIRFAKYCQRLQSNFSPTFDSEFKKFLEFRGYNIDISDFELRFNRPMNFAEWTKIEMMNSSISLFTQMVEMPFISKRLAMEEFLQWDEEKIARNARMWREENPSKLKGLAGMVADDDLLDGAPGLQSVGVAPGNDFDMEPDEGSGDEFGNEEGLSSPLGGSEGPAEEI